MTQECYNPTEKNKYHHSTLELIWSCFPPNVSSPKNTKTTSRKKMKEASRDYRAKSDQY